MLGRVRNGSTEPCRILERLGLPFDLGGRRRGMGQELDLIYIRGRSLCLLCGGDRIGSLGDNTGDQLGEYSNNPNERRWGWEEWRGNKSCL